MLASAFAGQTSVAQIVESAVEQKCRGRKLPTVPSLDCQDIGVLGCRRDGGLSRPWKRTARIILCFLILRSPQVWHYLNQSIEDNNFYVDDLLKGTAPDS